VGMFLTGVSTIPARGFKLSEGFILVPQTGRSNGIIPGLPHEQLLLLTHIQELLDPPETQSKWNVHSRDSLFNIDISC
jgi:hypothetical protein